MQKLDKDLYKKHAKRLNAIIDEKSTFAPYLKRKDFALVIKNELNVLQACENIFSKDKLDSKLSAKSLTKKYCTITKDDFKLDEKYKYGDQGDLIDSINYLNTFCKNMFKVNLDDLVEGKKITATDPKIDLRSKPHFDDEGPRMNSNFAFAGGGIPLAATPYENPYLVGKAYAKLQDDMNQGKFYRFKTKPRIVPISKWMASIVSILLIIGLLLASVFAFMADGIQALAADNTPVAISMISNGVFYILAGGFGIYPLYITMRTLVGKSSKDENQRYTFNWVFIMMFLILAVLFCLMDTISVWRIQIVESTSVQAVGFDGLKYILIVCLSLVGVLIAPLILGSVNNPKPDNEKIEAKIKEYIDLFSAESGQMPVPPKMDNQKPVDVKDSKKSDKSKDDKKSKK